MRHFGYRRGRSPKRVFKTSIQHSPSSMGNSILTDAQLVTFQAVSTVPAGTSMANARIDTDRAVEVSNGEEVGNMTVTVGIFPGASNGYIEYAVFKAQRQSTTPVVGTFPMDSNSAVNSAGLQQIMRQNMPGWVYKFGTIPYTPETIHTRDIKISYRKFKVAKVRDGDFFGIVFFNRGASTVTFDWQARYKSYR